MKFEAMPRKSASLPGSQILVPPPAEDARLSRKSWANHTLDSDSESGESQQEAIDVMPPPLCPGMIMPTCEARFGVPMFELAEVQGEGEVGIVGLSGHTLLH